MLSGVNTTRLNIAEVAAPSTARTSRLTSPETDSREQHERDCSEVEGAPTDFDESESLPPAWVLQHSPPSPPIEQWLSPSATAFGIRQPERQFSPPHHSMMKTAKWTRTILFVAGQLKRIAVDCKCPAFCKSRMSAKISPRRHMAVLSAVCPTSTSSSFPTVSEQLRASRHKSVATGAYRWSNLRLNPFLRGDYEEKNPDFRRRFLSCAHYVFARTGSNLRLASRRRET